MTLTGRVLAGRYRVLEAIGQGGMAVVHRAHDEVLDRDVAVKLLRPAYASDPAFVARFRSEARHAAALHHPHIVTIHDQGTDPGTDSDRDADYIVMQLVDGPDLETLLRREGRLPLGQALRLGVETTQALQVAHEHGIVHRDVKPGNILIDRDGAVRVADFGIARAAGELGVTTAGTFFGSAQYASPEQVLGETVTPASDVYSLGVVLYEAITGQRPFEGSSPAAVALERLRIQPAPPSAVARDLPTDLDRIILRAMAREPADRYPSAAEFGVALEQFRLQGLGGVRRTGARVRETLAAVGVGAGLAVADGVGVGSASGSAADVRTASAVEPSAGVAPGTSASPTAAMVTASYDVSPQEDRRRRRFSPLALALPLGVVALALLIGLALFGGFGDRGDVLSSDGGSGSTGGASGGVALGPTPSANPSTTTPPSPSPTLSPAPILVPIATPTPTPMATPTPSPRPTPRPTPKSTPTPSPRPTPRPTPKSTPTPTKAPAPGPTAPARDPAETVVRFYALVQEHRYDEAAALWTARLRQEYPPETNINGRFDRTTKIVINRLSIRSMSLSKKTAVVFVDLTEYRRSQTARRYIGTWDLVLTRSGWLMDEPHF